MQGKEIAQEQKTAPPKAPENNNTTVKAEQKNQQYQFQNSNAT